MIRQQQSQHDFVKPINSARSSTGKEESKQEGMGITLTDYSGMQPDEQKIKQSVLKGLWFPILTNLTNLIMEKRRDVQDKSSQIFFRVFNHYGSDFTLDFWKEILTQIVLPLLEDIHLAVEIPNKK